MEGLVLLLLWLATFFAGILLGYRIARKNMLEMFKTMNERNTSTDSADWWKSGETTDE